MHPPNHHHWNKQTHSGTIRNQPCNHNNSHPVTPHAAIKLNTHAQWPRTHSPSPKSQCCVTHRWCNSRAYSWTRGPRGSGRTPGTWWWSDAREWARRTWARCWGRPSPRTGPPAPATTRGRACRTRTRAWTWPCPAEGRWGPAGPRSEGTECSPYRPWTCEEGEARMGMREIVNESLVLATPVQQHLSLVLNEQQMGLSVSSFSYFLLIFPPSWVTGAFTEELLCSQLHK